jgi:hypothetical protein
VTAFRNQYGEIPIGTRVNFQMENANLWFGDTEGVLALDATSGKHVIDTENSGRIGIDGWLEAYGNTICPVDFDDA